MIPGLPGRPGRHSGRPSWRQQREPTESFREIRLPPELTDELQRPAPTRATWGLPRPPSSPSSPPQQTGAEALAEDPIADAQRRLLASSIIAGRYPGLAVTGVLDGVTRAALAEFQHQVGLSVTGSLDRSTEIALGAITTVPGLPGPLPAEPAREKLQLSRGLMAVVTGIGMLLTVLMLVDGWGIISGGLRDTIAVIIAAATPVVVYFLPSWKPPAKGGS